MKQIYFVTKTFFLVLAFVFISVFANAQTAPVAQALPYSQNFSALVSTSTTYPAGWQGWSLSASGPPASFGAFRTIAPPANLALIASGTAASTTGGVYNYNGKIGMLASSSADPSICLALSTTGNSNIQVNFDVMTIRNPFDGITNTRINGIDLQYQVGAITGTWISVTGLTDGIYQNNTTAQTTAVTTPQNSQSKSLTLPAACNNQSLVYLRWVERDISGAGSRASFAFDNIVTCPITTPTITISGSTSFCSGGTSTYTSSITNGGTAPSYTWKKNGTTVGTNNPVLMIGNLVVTDQISCVLTSNIGCATSATANSNVITISSINSSPTISNASITNVSCPGLKNGAINISVTGGTAPYTICWDTINKASGAMFGVTTGLKTASDPYFGVGNGSTFFINGIEAPILRLIKGITYTFNVLTPAHPFHISTDITGGNANFIVNNGQTGAPTQNGTVTFTPNNSHPPLLYYDCQNHQFMGYQLQVQNGYCVEDLMNLSSGIYTVIVSDANGCSTSAQYTVTEMPSPISLSANITGTTCSGTSDGSIDLTISGGTAPYSVCWDTVNKTNGAMFGVTVGTKTHDNPTFGLGNGLAFYTDGIEAKELFLTKGISYTFNIANPGHPWHISTDPIGGSAAGLVTSGQSGAPDDFGTVTFTPNNSHPSLLYYDCSFHQYMGYNVNIVSGYCVEDPVNLPEGIYTVIVTDASGCSATAQYSVGELPSSISLSANVTDVSCPGMNDGSIDLNISGGTGPYTVCWDTSNTESGAMFGVTVGDMTPSNPFFGFAGNRGLSFYINGIEGKELFLMKGITYSFNVFNSTHLWHISTDPVGGNTANIVTNGQTGAPTDNGLVTFFPNNSHPSLLYYDCGIHAYMGGNVNIIDGYCVENPSNLHEGIYTVAVTDANGCSATAAFTVGALGCSTTLHLKVLIEGFYSGNETMNAVVDPINYPTLCDTITVELHDANSPYDVVYGVTDTIDIHGNGNFVFPGSVQGNNYYIVIHHRNTIETWSKDPVLFDSPAISFDFTTP